MDIQPLVEYSIKNFSSIQQIMQPLKLLEIDSFYLMRFNSDQKIFLLTEDISAQQMFFERKLFNEFHAFINPLYIEDGNYLCPLKQLYDSDLYQVHNELFNCLSSAVWFRKYDDMLDIYFFGSSSKFIAYENLYQVLQCYIQNIESNYSSIYKQEFIDILHILGLNVYKKKKIISAVDRHQKLEKNLISHISLDPKEKDFIFEFMQNWSYKEIAQNLNITERSIYNYINRLKSRFSIGKGSDLKSYLREHMLV
ncbi:helix-turn-helix transcriptional regulator [Cysteiniphilum halobium]|uniref:helix-turn-helix transcriptional regulator n=1 Tax=Cysteiniphilum halobium TaxID=2219059 RepID=UPI000E656981|nr:sigma factor-like helix-turn-helix DNA-binding protein [Cysteiniphilum halobium]